MSSTRRSRIAHCIAVAALAGALAACAVAPPRTDDPLQNFNRRMFAFNQFADKVAIRPAAKAYVKVTGPKGRVLIGNFFANLRTPVTIVNEVLQGRPEPALQSTGRFLINSTVGFLGFFDPASDMKLSAHPTDFGVTLAHWGVPEGPYLVLPFVGPTTLRDVWRLPVDSYFDPLGWYAREHDFKWHAQYLPSIAYLVTLRASALPIDPMIDSAYDPYAFMRDAYRQHRLYEIYYGNPPMSAIEELQGTTPSDNGDQDIDQLLQQQQQYEQSHGLNPNAAPPPASSAPPPASASSTPPPASSGG
ncbi:MAG: Outer-membrane-phospholipid-binding lipoprotein MlaA [Rhodanobacteraceae bacterium]|jgi:phospholipid-binding lipoprotein MlaA|nr:MAG: Outer-membrane-phospholipid-binding lipoprotein MlaA [Rhodanobacteraceae bacterium]